MKAMTAMLWFALVLLLLLQITHMQVDFRGNGRAAAVLAATAFIIGINVAYSACFERWQNNAITPPLIVVMCMLAFCSWLSVNSSVRAFAKNKHQTIMDEEAGPAAAAYKDQMQIARNQMVKLNNSGVTGGASMEKAKQDLKQAEAEYIRASANKSESAYALAVTGGKEDADRNAHVNTQSWMQGFGLEFICAAISIMLGLGREVNSKLDMVMSETKKTQGGSHPRPKK